MDVNTYFESLSDELRILKDRIRMIMTNPHWQKDGEWKESVLKTAIRRHLPSSFKVGTGFIVTPDSDSTQIDILVYEDTTPILFQDGDFVILPPVGIKAIIEVKAKVYNASKLEEYLKKLGDISELIGSLQLSLPQAVRQQMNNHKPLFVGFFSYESNNIKDINIGDALESAARAGRSPHNRIVNHVSLNDHTFIKYWENDPIYPQTRWGINEWHIYDLPNKSFGYFIQNVVNSVASEQVDVSPAIWFPAEGKESQAIYRKPFNHVPDV